MAINIQFIGAAGEVTDGCHRVTKAGVSEI
jgi:hypothetical protein